MKVIMVEKSNKFFINNNYDVIEQAINPSLALFVYNYFRLKKQTHKVLLDNGYISKFNNLLGTISDSQCPGAYAHYADNAMEILLMMVKPTIEKFTGLNLIETYSYARLYTKGNELKRHTDRISCEISATMNLGGDLWPIFVDPTKQKNQKGVEVNLNAGDLLIYKGNILEHWREPFDGNECCQVFLHYNDVDKQGKDNKFDGRPYLGLPGQFRSK